jgi:hypothetical protein
MAGASLEGQLAVAEGVVKELRVGLVGEALRLKAIF